MVNGLKIEKNIIILDKSRSKTTAEELLINSKLGNS